MLIYMVKEQLRRSPSPSWPTLLIYTVTTLWTSGWTWCWLRKKVEELSLVPSACWRKTRLKRCVSPAGIKLDFKSLDSVGLSLDVLSEKHRRKPINRPVWLNADIVRGPNTPSFVPPINGTQYVHPQSWICFVLFHLIIWHFFLYELIGNGSRMNNMSSAWLFSFFRFLRLIQEKFPHVTVSPGWMVCMAWDAFSLVLHTNLMI